MSHELERRLLIGVDAPLVKSRGVEEETLEALGRGEVGNALSLLMDGYGDEIFRHCLAVVGAEALAADVHQTVFVQAYRDLPRFRGGSTLRTWLYAIARHRCLDALRSRKRWLRRFVSHAEPPEAAVPARLAEVADSHLRAKALGRALDELKPRVRVAVVLRYQQEMSFLEMSEVCGEAPKTLQARVARALPVLRRHLERAGFGGQS